jgi:hypothetical protein
MVINDRQNLFDLHDFRVVPYVDLTAVRFWSDGIGSRGIPPPKEILWFGKQPSFCSV